MFDHPKHIGLRFALALVTAWGAATPGMTQVRSPASFPGPANAGRALPGIQPFFHIAPGLNLQQAAYNTTVLGQAYQNVPPYALPFTPGYALGFSPLTNPGAVAAGLAAGSSFFYNSPASLYGNPYAASNPYALSSPYGLANGYGTGYAPPTGYSPAGAYGQNGYSDPYSGYLRGSADVIRGQATYLVSARQANLLAEQVQREKIENRRKALDEWLYERDKIPTAEEERDRNRTQELRRARNGAPAGEVLSGKALNALLDHLTRLPAGDVPGRPAPVAEEVLGRINVIPQGTAGNPALLKEAGNLRWPAAFRGDDFRPDRELLTSLVPDAVQQAARHGRVGSATLDDMAGAVGRLRKRLAGSIKDLPVAQHLEAKRLLANLEDALTVLRRPDAGNYVNGTYRARGPTVPELVENMRGLQVAPATPGDESAYAALYTALAAFDTAAQAQLAGGR